MNERRAMSNFFNETKEIVQALTVIKSKEVQKLWMNFESRVDSRRERKLAAEPPGHV